MSTHEGALKKGVHDQSAGFTEVLGLCGRFKNHLSPRQAMHMQACRCSIVETRPSTLITQMPSICPLLRGMWPNAPGLLVCIFQTPNHHDRLMVSQTAMREGFVNRPRNTWIACHFNFIYRVGLRRRGHIVLFRSPNGSTGSITTFLDCLVLPITHSYHSQLVRSRTFFFLAKWVRV